MEDFIDDKEIKEAKKEAKGAFNAIKNILIKLISSTLGRVFRVILGLLKHLG